MISVSASGSWSCRWLSHDDGPTKAVSERSFQPGKRKERVLEWLPTFVYSVEIMVQCT